MLVPKNTTKIMRNFRNTNTGTGSFKLPAPVLTVLHIGISGRITFFHICYIATGIYFFIVFIA